MHIYNKGLTELNQQGWYPLIHAEWLDAYNRSTNSNGTSGTILCTISSANMHWVTTLRENEINHIQTHAQYDR